MVSIIMGTNCKSEKIEGLKLSIDSILMQTYSDFEFIICENGASLEAKSYLDTIEDNRVKVVHSNEHFSLSQKLNFCISLSKGSIIARMDDDDISKPNRIQEQVDFLQNNKELSFVGCNVNYIDKNGIVMERIFPKYPQIKDFLFNLPYVHPTLCFKKQAISAVKGYNESYWCDGCEDYEILLRLYENGIFGANLQKTLLDYNIHHSFHCRMPYRMRVNEAITRARRFYKLKLLPRYSIYVLKPLIVGVIPLPVLKSLKSNLWKLRKQ